LLVEGARERDPNEKREHEQEHREEEAGDVTAAARSDSGASIVSFEHGL